ncbi:MAG: hypothetical protein ABI895_42680 [Deltaproteobacteria bacterium]
MNLFTEQVHSHIMGGPSTCAPYCSGNALAAKQPGPFQIEAAISAVHCKARTADDTDWAEIAALYILLEGFHATPAVRVNRAFAVARAHGPAAGLALLESTDVDGIASYPYVHLVRGTLLGELSRFEEALRALRRADEHAENAHERAQIRSRIHQLEASAGPEETK